ncbi:hypothetical protein OV450_3261 [Actinobacteria bacterium OV450]|nr:hypothetical protein OV450_3261 [Actinobacteria bacterium OV450]
MRAALLTAPARRAAAGLLLHLVRPAHAPDRPGGRGAPTGRVRRRDAGCIVLITPFRPPRRAATGLSRAAVVAWVTDMTCRRVGARACGLADRRAAT